jgi:cystathionine beta-lyase/cystathionine gamma-synthase
VVDNTFTPLAVTPSAWGADVVVHSLTKFVSGASDIIAGAVCGSAAFVGSLMDLHMGECPCPWCVCVWGGGRKHSMQTGLGGGTTPLTAWPFVCEKHK